MRSMMWASQANLMVIGISMICAWPFPQQYRVMAFVAGGVIVLWYFMLGGCFDRKTGKYPYELLMGDHDKLNPRLYAWKSAGASLPVELRSDALTAVVWATILIYTGQLYRSDNSWCLPVAYLGMWPAMKSFRLVKCWRRANQTSTYAWLVDKQYLFWVLPALRKIQIYPKAKLHLLSCPTDINQAAFASAISDRRASLYLVSTDAVIPVCYNPEENEQAVEQLRIETFQREIAMVTLDENPMPVPASSGVLALWAVGSLVGFYFLLGCLYHLAHGNLQVTKQILPLVSVLCTWGVLEVYSVVLRHKGYARMRKAVGL